MLHLSSSQRFRFRLSDASDSVRSVRPLRLRLRSGLALVFAVSVGCGEAPPPRPKVDTVKTIRIHVSNGSRVDVCRVEACGEPGRAVETASPDLPLRPHAGGLYEVRACNAPSLRVVPCANENTGERACIKATGGRVEEGSMFRVVPCL